MDIRRLTEAQRFSVEKMQKIGIFETDRMFTDIYCLEAGQAQRAHTHDNADKVYFVMEGTARVLVGSDEEDVAAGSAVLAPAGIEHGVRNTSDGRTVILVFMAPNPNRG